MWVSVPWEIRGCWLGAVCICALEAVHDRHGWVDWAPEMPKTEKKVIAAIVAKQKSLICFPFHIILLRSSSYLYGLSTLCMFLWESLALTTASKNVLFFNLASWRFQPVAWTWSCPHHGHPPPLWRSRSVESCFNSWFTSSNSAETKPSKSSQPTWPTGTLSTLSWLSIELLTSFMSPHSVLSWNTLSLSSFGTITLINSRNLFVSEYVFGIYSNSNQVWCAMLFLSEIAGLSMLAAWKSFSFTVFGNLFSSLLCCLT